MDEISNPNQLLPDDVVTALRRLQESAFSARRREAELGRLSRPTADERRRLFELKREAFSGEGPREGALERIAELRRRQFTRVEATLRERIAGPADFRLLPIELLPPPAPPVDPFFLWARTDWWWDPGMQAHFHDDGLHFTGGPTSHDGDLKYYSFGANAVFAIDPGRLPPPNAGFFGSTPHVELFGGLVAHTGDDDLFTGDLWSKCWMHRDQQIFQLDFGRTGPEPVVLGQAHEVEALIFEENADRTVHVPLRGFQWMPPVHFRGINVANTLLAKLEIRFDIQLEGAGALLWTDPEVLLRTFHWPLRSI